MNIVIALFLTGLVFTLATFVLSVAASESYSELPRALAWIFGLLSIVTFLAAIWTSLATGYTL